MNQSEVANGIILGTTICDLEPESLGPSKNAINKYRVDFEEWINEERAR